MTSTLYPRPANLALRGHCWIARGSWRRTRGRTGSLWKQGPTTLPRSVSMRAWVGSWSKAAFSDTTWCCELLADEVCPIAAAHAIGKPSLAAIRSFATHAELQYHDVADVELGGGLQRHAPFAEIRTHGVL